MEYVVTGGAGYIGGHLVDKLVGISDSVGVIDDMSKGTYVNSKAALQKADLRDAKFEIPKESTVFHLAADPDIKDSMENINLHFSRDVTATLNLLETMRKADGNAFVFASTSAVYGNAEQIPTKETAPTHPISNYAMYKCLCEEMARYYSETYGIKTIALRFANIVGGRTGHGILHNFVNKIKDGEPFEIWGDGKQNKNYVYIDDLIEAMLLLTDKSAKNFDVFNIGSYGTTTVDEIVKTFRLAIGKHYDAVNIEAQKGDVRSMLLDISKAESFGWSPKLNSNDAVARAISDLLKLNGMPDHLTLKPLPK